MDLTCPQKAKGKNFTPVKNTRYTVSLEESITSPRSTYHLDKPSDFFIIFNGGQWKQLW